ncbi:MAG: hypothetical protein M3092_00980 [Actinomycetia bacterium]|nr:hypothetical protein [Actinomycetes bacterium]
MGAIDEELVALAYSVTRGTGIPVRGFGPYPPTDDSDEDIRGGLESLLELPGDELEVEPGDSYWEWSFTRRPERSSRAPT